MNRNRLLAALLAAISTSAHAVIPTGFESTPGVTPSDHVTIIPYTGDDHNGYAGTFGTITFNDWGYVGPDGVGANDFQVGTGFDADNIGQIQSVVTTAPDWLTPDASSVHEGVNSVETDFGTPVLGYGVPLSGANMDGGVNFYEWAYTTPTGSTFSNMKIDKAGNYFIAKDDMAFGFYETFTHNNGATIENVDTGINFQPYAISDAKGWCGSTLVEDPDGLSQMAGQVTFDFAFDAYLNDNVPGGTGFGSTPNTQIVPDFVMRSYGDYEVNVTNTDGNTQQYTGSAVGNNFNPVTGELDPNFQNQVSFLGAGVLPEGVWIIDNGLNPDGTKNVTIVDEGTAGATWHTNSFGGYAFLLRADAERTLELISPEGHSIYVETAVVPVPAAVWLFASGLLGLIGVARRSTTRQS